MATSAPASTPPAGASNVELVRWAFETLSRHDVDALKPFWTDETVERFPQETCVGAEAIAAYFKALFASFPDARIEPLTVAGDGEHVFVQWKLTGTFTGAPFRGFDANGQSVAVDGIDHFVVRDGRVISNFVVADQMQFARQLGLLPDEDTPADRALKTAFNLKTKILSRRR